MCYNIETLYRLFIFYEAERFDIAGKESLKSNRKRFLDYLREFSISETVEVNGRKSGCVLVSCVAEQPAESESDSVYPADGQPIMAEEKVSSNPDDDSMVDETQQHEAGRI